MVKAAIASFVLASLAPAANVAPQKTIVNLGSNIFAQPVQRFYDQELNVACYVVVSGYNQTRIDCVKL